MAATHFKSIPIIDISALVAKSNDENMANDVDVLQVIKQLDEACRQTGFFYVEGHGIPESLMKEVRDLTHEFFDLSLEEKLKIKLSPSTGYRGYQEIGINVTKGARDAHEAIDYYREIKPGMYGNMGRPMEGPNLWPSNPQNFKAVIEQYTDLCTELSRNIMRGIAVALGGHANVLEGCIAGDPFWVLRLIGYPANLKDNTAIGCGIHTDYGLLTLLNQDENINALQVQNCSGEWIWAPPIPGTFVCNIGDMLKILSNGQYESTVHRVIHLSPKYRVSIAYFYEPNYNASIQPLDNLVKKSNETKKLGPAIYGEHLVGKVTNNFVFK